MTYNVTDSQGHAATEVTRTVNVVDTTAPVITLVGSTPIDVEAGSVYVDAGATAWDSFDGDLTGSIFTVNPVNTATGRHLHHHLHRVRLVRQRRYPRHPHRQRDRHHRPRHHPARLHPDRCRSRLGLCDAGATAWDAFDGDLTASIVTVNPVDTAILGTYTVTYNVTDSSGNAALR